MVPSGSTNVKQNLTYPATISTIKLEREERSKRKPKGKKRKLITKVSQIEATVQRHLLQKLLSRRS